MRLKIIGLITLILSTAVCAYAGTVYTTPDSWSQHYTPSGIRASAKGIPVKDGELRLGLTARNHTLFFNDSNKNNAYVNFRGFLTGVSLGDGSVDVNLNMRAATNTSAGVKNDRYDVLYNSVDASLEDNDWDARLYQGNIVFNDVIKYTTLSLGRIYTEHLNEIQLDGGDLITGTDKYKVFIAYGKPVSVYETSETEYLTGGFDISPNDDFRLRGEISQFDDSSSRNADTTLWKLRADFDYAFDLLEGGIYSEGGQQEDAWNYELGTYGNTSTGLDFNIWIRGQYDTAGEEINPFISDYEYVLGARSEYIQAGFDLQQGINRHVAVGVGFDTQNNFDTFYGDRDYYRYHTNLMLQDLIPNNYIVLTAEYWDILSDGDYKGNKKLFIGGKVSQVISEKAEAWAGLSLMDYRYYLKQFDILPSRAEANRRMDNKVYVAYVGGFYELMENLTLQSDISYEHSGVMDEVDSEYKSNVSMFLSANYNF